MARYAAFLRAINLGRNRRVSGAELRSLFERAGAEDVESFRTSGNVVFSATGRAAEIAGGIEEALAGELGYEVPVFLRSAREVNAIAGQEPFTASQLAATEGRLQVSLLAAKPAASAREQVLALETADDRLAFGPRELYWLPAAGTQGSALDTKAIETLVGPSTMRTKGTLELLAEKYFAG